MDERTILKLGGSVITDKSGDCEIAVRELGLICKEIAAHYREGLVIVHGAGSCGHPQAKRFGLNEGLRRESLSGVFLTHRAVCRLNACVVNALRGCGVEAVGVHPLGSVVTEDGRIVAMEIRPLERMVAEGIVPVLHGDVVMDLSRGAAILSGDRLLVHLALALGIRRVGLATDVAGVMEEGKVIRFITASEERMAMIGGSGHVDVTGGMKGKVQELLALATAGIDAHIFHASRIADFMEGREHGGTIVLGSGRAHER